MRLPFLQVAQEEMARARTLAGFLGVPYTHALGMTVALKAAALEAASEDVSGAIDDPNPAEWMAVQCGWPLDDAQRLANALLRCGFAMAGPCGGYSVAGMGPYAEALKTSAKRAEAGRRGAEIRKSKGGYGRAMAGPQPSDSQGMARDAKTQTQTHIEDPSAAGASDAKRPSLRLTPTPAEKVRKPSEQERLAELICQQRAEFLGPDVVPDPYPLGRLNKMCLPLLEVDPELLRKGHAAFCRNEYALSRSPPAPLWLFCQEWAKWVDIARRGTA